MQTNSIETICFVLNVALKAFRFNFCYTFLRIVEYQIISFCVRWEASKANERKKEAEDAGRVLEMFSKNSGRINDKINVIFGQM